MCRRSVLAIIWFIFELVCSCSCKALSLKEDAQLAAMRECDCLVPIGLLEMKKFPNLASNVLRERERELIRTPDKWSFPLTCTCSQSVIPMRGRVDASIHTSLRPVTQLAIKHSYNI